MSEPMYTVKIVRDLRVIANEIDEKKPELTVISKITVKTADIVDVINKYIK